MAREPRDFQVFVKPAGPLCNLDCQYCYYLKKDSLFPDTGTFRMPDILLEEYIVQHFEASTGPVTRFSWHGGEPTVLGLDYFQGITSLQKKHCPPNRRFVNGMQTNGILLDDDWCRFLSEEKFSIGLSLDGPKEFHDRFRKTKGGGPTFEATMRGLRLLQKHSIGFDILCVVNSHNVLHPLEVYSFFKHWGASYVSFLPLVEPPIDAGGGVSERTVPAEAFGVFLTTIFDQWAENDIGRIKVQVFEEALRTAFKQDHSLCIFRETCGDIPVIEHNGDFFSCDHYVDREHRLGNIIETPLAELLDSPAQRAFGSAKLNTLPQYCLDCDVRDMCNGECPKNRFRLTPDEEEGLNYLCPGYRRFFNHCQPFVNAVAAVWKQQGEEEKDT